MQTLKGSKTEKNLLKAFAGESQARNRYTYFAKKAQQEGYIQISHIFEETANQEREHAKVYFKYLQGGDVEFTAVFPAGIIGTTAENLKAAAAGENFEWTDLYPSFAETAREEGFHDIAKSFDAICIAEKQHEKRYNDLLANLKESKVFKKEGKVKWRCLNCGFIHEGTEAPDKCDACRHSKSWFELLGENW